MKNSIEMPLFVQKLLASVLYYALFALGFLVYVCPFGAKKALAGVVSRIWFHLFPFRVKTILHNLFLVFPRSEEETVASYRKRINRLCRANQSHMFLLVLETLERFHWKKKDQGKKFLVKGEEHLSAHTEQGVGVFILTAHIGNWELISRVGVMIGVRLSIVTRFLRNPFFDALWIKSRESYGLELLEESGSGLSIVKAVKRGRALGFIFDQHTGEPHGRKSQFLGHEAWSPKGLAMMNRRLRAPILPAYTYRDEKGRTVVVIEKSLSFCDESSAKGDAFLAYHVKTCNDKIEEWVQRHPEQYLWMHRRFKNILDYRSSLPY